MRSFHVGFEDGHGPPCNAMNMPQDLHMQMLGSPDPMECPACLSNVHRCFACGKEGMSRA